VKPTSPLRAILSVAAAGSAGNYVYFALSPVQETMRTALGLTDNQMALLQGPGTALPLIVGALPIGLLIDRKSRVTMLLLGLLAGAIGTLLTAFPYGFGILLIARCLAGLSSTAISMAATSLIADFSAASERGRATMALAWGQVIGSSAIFAVCGYLLGAFEGNPAGWRWTLVIATGLLAPVAILILTLREPERSNPAVQKRPLIGELKALRPYWAAASCLIAGRVIVRVADGAAGVWTAPMFARDFGLPPAQVGAVMSTVILASGLLGPAIAGFLADKCQKAGGPRQTIRMFSYWVLLSVPFALYPLAPGVGAASALFMAFYMIGVMAGVLVTTIMTVVIPSEQYGVCLGIMLVVEGVFGVGLAPLLVSTLSTVMGGPHYVGKALAIVCAMTSLAGSVVLFSSQRFFPGKREAE
jgi:MFS transporter, Spinster family, sphingosine-1-phosphate transporter